MTTLTTEPTTWFEAHADELTRVRAHVRAVLTVHGVELATIGQAELLVSELATNVVLHTESPRLGVAVATSPSRVSVEVREALRSAVPLHMTGWRPTALESDHGRGLSILDWLAAEWGIRRHRRETITWFDLDRDGVSPEQADAERGDEAEVVESLRAALGRSQLLLRVAEALAPATTVADIDASVSRTLRPHLGARTVTVAPGRPHGTPQLGADGPTRSDAVHVPLTDGGDTIATLSVTWAETVDIDVETRALLLVVAGYAADALTRG